VPWETANRASELMAKRFRFRLETLRRVRRQRRDDCRRAVAARLRQIAGVQDQIDGFTDQIELHTAAMRGLASPSSPGTAAPGVERAPPVCTIDLTAVRRYRAYTNYLRYGITAARRQVAALQGELAREQGVLAEATKAVKILDKLEERQRRDHDLTLARLDRAESDEIAAQCARRNALTNVPVAVTDDRP